MLTIRPKHWIISGMVALIALSAAALPALANDNDRHRGTETESAWHGPVFTHNVHWVSVPGTRVYTIRTQDRPDYDAFRYNNAYFVYRDGNWYRARRWRGPFTTVRMEMVPTQLRDVPRDRWHSYPTGWDNDPQSSHDRGHGRHHRH